jgi:hypothetical protein
MSDRNSLILPFSLLLAISFFGSVAAADPVRFDRDIRPILSDKCFFCHGPDREHREADLRLDLEELAKEQAIVPGDADASELIVRILSGDPDSIMPPPDANKELSQEERELLIRWVNEGANWTQHWSFMPPQPPRRPQVKDRNWIGNPIDEFALAKMEAKGLTPSVEASREKLIRRLTFDLTGLPPTLAEIDAFLADRSADAYEKVVDRLLQSSHYGERMALMWLDAARYGDTSVYHADGPRDMWAWRDAVIKAYNDNLPFDQFSIQQLAGDLIPDATIEQKILSGFNRNNGTTDEGGAIAEEYRVEYAVDRVKTTATVWMGLTMECAQCHDHKYDPISQEDYYKFYAFFNVSDDGGMQTRKGNATPKLDVPDPEKQRQLPVVQSQLADAKLQLETLTANIGPEFEAWLVKQHSSDEVAAASVESVLHAPLWEGQGKKVADLSDTERRGEIKGKVEWVKSRVDWALKLNGSNYVDLGDVGNFERTDKFSYGGWVKPQKGARDGALLARMDDGNAFRGYDMLLGDGMISVHIINTWPANAIKVKTKKSLKPDQWQHVLMTYDGSSQASGIKIYVDGELWDWDIEQDGLTETIRTDKTLLIGSRHPGSRFKGEIDEVYLFDRRLEQGEVKQVAQSDSMKTLLAIAPDQRTDQQVDSLRQYYLATESETHQQLTKQIAELTDREAELNKPLTSVMIMGDMEKPRETFVLLRGAYDSPSETKVQPETISALPPMRAAAPRNRLGLAQWLFRDDHPLTARVAVNRYWQTFFGTGLVATPEDFGAQGDFPSHPELLDYLAIDFRDSGWNIKRLVKQIVMSSTYRQSSSADPDLYRLDPQNRLLARGSRFRLQGEFIRDNALTLSGLLINKFGGPGVKPYQPPGLWAEVGLGGNPKFKQDHGEKLYRRTVYTYWKRSAPPPAMQIFDAPTREKCTIRRPRTNTPLQALVTLNDTQFVEAARHFGQRIMLQGGSDLDSRLQYAFRLATARQPKKSELATLAEVYAAALAQYQADLESAKTLLAIGEQKRDESLDVAEHAAWTIAAGVVLNLDETLVRE